MIVSIELNTHCTEESYPVYNVPVVDVVIERDHLLE
jgi:hypothetical protein